MSLHYWLAFVAAASIMLAIPGPTILTVISCSVSHGRRAALPLVAGVALGDSTALALSLLGLSALLATSAFWFTIVKLAGGLYLIYLGWAMLRNDAPQAAPVATAAATSAGTLFTTAYLVTALNPKGIIFFVAFLPQFITPGAAAGPQLWILAVTFVTLATLNATIYAICAAAIRKLATSHRGRTIFHRTGGTLLIGAGIWAVMARRLS